MKIMTQNDFDLPKHILQYLRMCDSYFFPSREQRQIYLVIY